MLSILMSTPFHSESGKWRAIRKHPDKKHMIVDAKDGERGTGRKCAYLVGWDREGNLIIEFPISM